MSLTAKSPILQISEGYRAARRTTSILCGLALAWSAAQFDLKTISLGFAENIDFSGASVPAILLCAIGYTSVRCWLEFSMQSVEVRRWPLAQIDLKLSVFIVRATILVLAASGFDRSVNTVLYVLLAALGVILGSSLALFLGMMMLLPLFSYIRSRQGRNSVAARVNESFAWSGLIVLILLVALLVTLGVASLQYEPLRSLWTVEPSPFAMGFFVLASIAIVISIYLQQVFYMKLFATPPAFTEKHLPDGMVQVTFHNLTPAVWDWYSDPANAKQHADKSSIE